MLSSFTRDPLDLFGDPFGMLGRWGGRDWGTRRLGFGGGGGGTLTTPRETTDVGFPNVNTGFWDFGRYMSEPLALNVEEKDDQYLMTVYPPSDVKPESLKIEIRNGVLTIHGEHYEESERPGSRRRSFRSFNRSMTLPDNVDDKKINAELDSKSNNLRIHLPKAERTATRRLPIAGLQQEAGKTEQPAATVAKT